MAGEISISNSDIHAEVIDQSEEFIAIIHRSVLGVYRNLANCAVIRRLLAADNNFNCGKVYAYAEFLVFQREFARRFADASSAACINSFSALLLKNDISVSNLVEFMDPLLTPEIKQLAFAGLDDKARSS